MRHTGFLAHPAPDPSESGALGRLLICSKSTWDPAIRREHALARLVAAAGGEPIFLERPLDVRAFLRGDGPAFLRAFAGRGARTVGGVRVEPTAVPVPGHRSRAAQTASAALLRRRLRARIASKGPTTVLVTTPWQWSALDGVTGVRRVFDAADDWGALIPARREAFAAMTARIAASADRVVLANPAARDAFPGARTTVVRNGVEARMIDAPAAQSPVPRSLVYLGTLSPRFDAPLVHALLERLPDWTLDLYGQAQYPERGDQPDDELAALLALGQTRVRWHGPVAREGVPAALDAAAVAILPNRPELTVGQDAMKLYDYAARGLPVVTTRWNPALATEGPPHLHLADDAEGFAAAIEDAAAEPAERRAARRDWARGETYERRWPAWREAVFGA